MAVERSAVHAVIVSRFEAVPGMPVEMYRAASLPWYTGKVVLLLRVNNC